MSEGRLAAFVRSKIKTDLDPHPALEQIRILHLNMPANHGPLNLDAVPYVTVDMLYGFMAFCCVFCVSLRLFINCLIVRCQNVCGQFENGLQKKVTFQVQVIYAAVNNISGHQNGNEVSFQYQIKSEGMSGPVILVSTREQAIATDMHI